MKDILRQIIYGAEVTVCNFQCCLNKYNSKQYKIVDYELINALIGMNIIEQNSGNFETHECHYSLNENFLLRENNIKTIKIDDIYRAILINNCKYISLNEHHINRRIENSFSELKIQLLRREKLKKIQNG